MPLSVLRRIRELTEDASTTGASLDDVTSVLRILWPASELQLDAEGLSYVNNDPGQDT